MAPCVNVNRKCLWNIFGMLDFLYNNTNWAVVQLLNGSVFSRKISTVIVGRANCIIAWILCLHMWLLPLYLREARQGLNCITWQFFEYISATLNFVAMLICRFHAFMNDASTSTIFNYFFGAKPQAELPAIVTPMAINAAISICCCRTR